MSVSEGLAALAIEIRGHGGCGFEPCETCTNPVPGEGNARATIAFVGEAPGREEDTQGRPFVGAAGRLLEQLLAGAIDLERGDVFITNVLKARPPGNRDPRAAEIAHSWPWCRPSSSSFAHESSCPSVVTRLAASYPLRQSPPRAGPCNGSPGRPITRCCIRRPRCARDLPAGMLEDIGGLPTALAAVPRRPRAPLPVCPAAARAAAAQARASAKR